MSVLKPYMDKGVLKVPSGQANPVQPAAIQQWQLKTAQDRMETILNGFYAKGNTKLDGVLAPYDGLSRGIRTPSSRLSIPNPIVTGQDAEKPSDKLILDGLDLR